MYLLNMLERLQKKWRVTPLQLVLILLTFAIGGSLTGYAGRKIVSLLGIDQNWLWVIVYIIIVVLLWPIAVLLISLLTGQFRFFSKYIRRIGVRVRVVSETRVESRQTRAGSLESGVGVDGSKRVFHLAIFASGAGSNAQKIIDHFRNDPSVRIALIICNNPSAGVLAIAAKENIPSLLIEKEKFFRGDGYLPELKQREIDFIVLAGFLWKLPSALIRAYPRKIINIHPALLPKYGGKGMYGENVHSSVINAGEKESGITIHYVDEHYDHGDIIFQASCPLAAGDTPATLSQRIHQLEHEHYPRVIEKLLDKLKS
jgi:formyltetrahydrofolate-dependent phosphoribosylglycinamide formyltransferase